MVRGMGGRNGAEGQFQVKMKVIGRPRRRQGKMKIVPYTIRVRDLIEGYSIDRWGQATVQKFGAHAFMCLVRNPRMPKGARLARDVS